MHPFLEQHCNEIMNFINYECYMDFIAIKLYRKLNETVSGIKEEYFIHDEYRVMDQIEEDLKNKLSGFFRVPNVFDSISREEFYEFVFDRLPEEC